MPFGLGKKDDWVGQPPIGEFKAKYLGGHKLYPQHKNVKVLIYSDKIHVTKLELDVPYSWMTNVENMNEENLSAARIFLLGVFALWAKKKKIYTVIQYKDPATEDQSFVFDFAKKIDEAQRLIYEKVLEARERG